MWSKLFTAAVALFLVVFVSAQAEASCRGISEGDIKKFVCSDGTIQNISMANGFIIVRTYNPESKTWSEARFPAADGVNLETVSISVQQGG